MTTNVVLMGGDRIGLGRLSDALEGPDFQVRVALDLSATTILVKAGSADVLVIDDLPQDTLQPLEELMKLDPDLEIVLVLGGLTPSEEQELLEVVGQIGIRTWLPRQLVSTPFFASTVAAAAERRRLRKENEELRKRLQQLEARLEEVRTEEALTHLPDQHDLQEYLARELEKGTALSLLVVGVDDFDLVRQTYGHETGERLLQDLVQLLQDGLRGVDVLTRGFAREQFAVILPGTQAGQARVVGQRIQHRLAAHVEDNSDLDVTPSVSVGIAEAYQDIEAGELVRQANDALREAQTAGGGLIVVAS